MNNITTIIWGNAVKQHFIKDVGAFQYYLAKIYNYKSTWLYFQEELPLMDNSFEEYVKLYNLGRIVEYEEKRIAVEKYLKNFYKNIDILCLYHYGGNSYHIADFIKKLNPKVKVWIKLDMNMGGFSHFYDGTKLRKFKNLIEKWKSRNVDLFTVETKYYYDILKNELPFERGRIKYLPNGVCDYGINVKEIDKIKKENVIVAVGRMGIYEKNYELLLDSLRYIDKKILKEWKIYFIGPRTEEFDIYKKRILKENNYLKEYVFFIDEINDREEVYKWFRRAKIYCMTSRSEGFPLATIEAIYFGASPIVTNYGLSVLDVVTRESYGVVVELSDPKIYGVALEQQMKVYIDYDEADNISKYARKKFAYPVLVKRLNEYLIGI